MIQAKVKQLVDICKIPNIQIDWRDGLRLGDTLFTFDMTKFCGLTIQVEKIAAGDEMLHPGYTHLHSLDDGTLYFFRPEHFEFIQDKKSPYRLKVIQIEVADFAYVIEAYNQDGGHCGRLNEMGQCRAMQRDWIRFGNLAEVGAALDAYMAHYLVDYKDVEVMYD